MYIYIYRSTYKDKRQMTALDISHLCLCSTLKCCRPKRQPLRPFHMKSDTHQINWFVEGIYHIHSLSLSIYIYIPYYPIYPPSSSRFWNNLFVINQVESSFFSWLTWAHEDKFARVKGSHVGSHWIWVTTGSSDWVNCVANMDVIIF